MTAVDLATKRCCACGEVKNLSEFHRNRSMPDGLRSDCKPCAIARVKASQAKRRAEIGEAAYLAERRAQVAKSRQDPRVARAHDEDSLARRAAARELRERHRAEYDHLVLLAKRGEL